MVELEYIGSRIRELRKDKGLTQKQLSDKMHCAESTISKIETGQFALTIETLAEIEKALDEDLEYILFERKIEGYILDAIKDLIKRFGRITTPNTYFDKNDSAALDPNELIFPFLDDSENLLILQMDENLLNFMRVVAVAEENRRDYDTRIKEALRILHESEPGEKVKSCCIASIEDINSILNKAVEKELKAKQASEILFEEEKIINIRQKD